MERWKAGPTLQRKRRRRRLQHAPRVTDCRPCIQVFTSLLHTDCARRGVVLDDRPVRSDAADGGSVRKRWLECGVPNNVVNDAIAGGVLNEDALHTGLLHLLRDSHDGTRFQLDGGREREGSGRGHLIETSLGNRQGCKFGAIIFNLMSYRALDDLRNALRNE